MKPVWPRKQIHFIKGKPHVSKWILMDSRRAPGYETRHFFKCAICDKISRTWGPS